MAWGQRHAPKPIPAVVGWFGWWLADAAQAWLAVPSADNAEQLRKALAAFEADEDVQACRPHRSVTASRL